MNHRIDAVLVPALALERGIYVSMFDELGEGNQIAKTAENASM
jgi:hypothetical protein